MIAANPYYTVYLIAVTILTVICLSNYKQETGNSLISTSNSGQILWGWIIAICFALFIGVRPISGQFVDMVNYNENYTYLYLGQNNEYTWNTDNKIFDNLLYWFGNNNLDIKDFFLLISCIYFLFTYQACAKLFPRNSILAFVVFLGAFSTFSYATNGIKAGAAASFFLCALAYRDKPIIATIYLLLSVGFHHSMVMPVVAYICAYLYKNPKTYFVFWILSFLIALFHITFFQILFGGLTDEHGANYLNPEDENWGGQTGFRLDFVIYSCLPIFIGYIAIFKYNLKSKTYTFLYNTYLLTNSVWMLCMYAAFTNRIAYLSWLMYPIVTIYPLLHKQFMANQTARMKQVVWVQLLFTLAMTFIYYG